MDVQDDGLESPDVGAWADEKHRLVSLYATLFSMGMKNIWDELAYVELFAGSGYSKIRDTARIIAGSPIRALAVERPFDKYIFCERNANRLSILKERVRRHSSTANVAYVLGDCNERAQDVLAEIPAYSQRHKVLSLCFVDPYGIGIKFDTIKTLSSRLVDFLVLLAVYMDANRNYDRYVSDDASKVDDFLGSSTWRVRWERAKWKAVAFPEFLATEFAASMESLGYLPTPLHRMKRVRSDEKNLPLYYIGLFSRNDRGHDFWDKVLKAGTDQRSFWD